MEIIARGQWLKPCFWKQPLFLGFSFGASFIDGEVKQNISQWRMRVKSKETEKMVSNLKLLTCCPERFL